MVIACILYPQGFALGYLCVSASHSLRKKSFYVQHPIRRTLRVNIFHFSFYILHFTFYIFHSFLYPLQFKNHFHPPSTPFPLFPLFTLFPLFPPSPLCPMPYALCSMLYALCSMLYALCSLPLPTATSSNTYAPEQFPPAVTTTRFRHNSQTARDTW